MQNRHREDMCREDMKYYSLKFPRVSAHFGEHMENIYAYAVEHAQTWRAQFYCRSESLVCSNIWRTADWDFRTRALRITHGARPFRNDGALVFANSRTNVWIRFLFERLKLIICSTVLKFHICIIEIIGAKRFNYI